MPTRRLLAVLDEIGVRAPAGPEVYRREWDTLGAEAIATRLAAATSAALAP